MRFGTPSYILTFFAFFSIEQNFALLVHGNSHSTNAIPASSGHNINLTEMMQILQNQTAELRNLKRQTESDRSTIQVLQNQTTELQNFKQQTESDRSTIQLLQNRVFFLEAELRKLNASKPPSSDELSAYLSNMKQIVQTMTENEEYDKNITKRLNDAVGNLENMKVQMRYTSLSLLDVHSKTEQMNATLSKVFNDGMSGISEQIANITRKVAFTVGVPSSSSSWNSGTLVFPRVVYNIGGGYDPNTGVFTAPVNGHFVFFVNVQSYSTNSIYTYLVLNGTPKVTTMAWSSTYTAYQAGPNLAVLRLQKGDRVWVKHYGGTGYYTQGSAPVTTFSGFLI